VGVAESGARTQRLFTKLRRAPSAESCRTVGLAPRGDVLSSAPNERIVAAVSVFASATGRARLAHPARISNWGAGRGILFCVSGIRAGALATAVCGARVTLPRPGFWRRSSERRARVARMAVALRCDGVADCADAQGTFSRKPAGAFSALCRSDERAASGPASGASVGVLGDCARRAAGFARRSKTFRG
jgi:hypothetical protein